MASYPEPGVVTATRVAAGDDGTRYDGFAMAFHWTTALLVLVQFATAEVWGYFDKPTRHTIIVAHMSFGILLTLVLLARIGWRLLPGHGVRDATTGWVELASKSVHYLLYALLAAQSVLGFVLRWSGNEAMSFFGLLIQPPFAEWSKASNKLVGTAHNWIGWAIVALAAGHAGAALFHHYVLRDNLLWRMLPGRHARDQAARQPAPRRVAGR